MNEINEAIDVSQIDGAIPEDFPEGVYIRNGDESFFLFQGLGSIISYKP